ncbi:MAG: 4Fe-4S binding protein [Candidatus Heimdallarchaeota archaeon]|nr:hypothetical protein [Candidatus Heimdallarchaeota archaeon]MCG3255471.1 4Fe-4S binding protein [Candidatus Heimdallarchaeota archaeon]MCK4610545.1 4Fe-4S binding protein [Candidatus Heimdallarchaeota archaeon]
MSFFVSFQSNISFKCIFCSICVSYCP